MHKLVRKLSSVVLVLGLSSSHALAARSQTDITIHCPGIGNGSEVLTNYGTYVAGTGHLNVNSDTATTPLFLANIVTGANIPADLLVSGYNNNGVVYNPTTGAVICYYNSTLNFDSFAVSYVMQNALHGYVVNADHQELHIKIPVGLTF